MNRIFRHALLSSLAILGLPSTSAFAQTVQGLTSGSSLLAIGYNTTADENFIASVSTTTGRTSLIKSLRFGGDGLSTFVASDDSAYVLSADYHLYDLDVSSGALSAAPSDPSLQALATSGSSLLALGYNSSTGNNFLASVNPTTVASTIVSTFSFNSGSYFPSTFT